MDNPPPRSKNALRTLISAACVVVVLGGLKLAAGLVVPVILAFFITVLSFPVMRFLQRYRVPRFLALIITLLLDLSVLAAFGVLAASLLTDFRVLWEGQYADRLRGLAVDTLNWTEKTLTDFGMEEARDTIFNVVNVDAVFKFATDNVGGVLGGITSAVGVTVLVLLLVGFMLVEGGATARKLAGVREAGGPDFHGWQRVTGDVQKYLGIKTAVSLATGLAAWGLCAWMGVEFALLWGLVTFALNFIPTIGSIIAAIPPMILALVQFGLAKSVLVGLGYFGINTIFGSIIEPTLQGRRLGISTLVVVLSVLFWGWLLGIAGAFLAVPLTMVVKVTLDMTPDLRWISVWLEQEKPVSPVAQAIVGTVAGEEPDKPPDGAAGHRG